jgi:hypothetical protein
MASLHAIRRALPHFVLRELDSHAAAAPVRTRPRGEHVSLKPSTPPRQPHARPRSIKEHRVIIENKSIENKSIDFEQEHRVSIENKSIENKSIDFEQEHRVSIENKSIE